MFLGRNRRRRAIVRLTPRPGNPEGHPLATPVNRDERISALVPAYFSNPSLQSLRPVSLHTWFSRLVAPLRTSHPSGSRPAHLAARGPWPHSRPQKTLCSPPRPIGAASSAGRTGLWLRCLHGCICAIQPLVAHGTGATNSLLTRTMQGGIGAGVQSGLMVLPTLSRHCRRRPFKHSAPYPNAFDTSKGLLSFITW
jgi:hypothetical protein